MVLGGRLAQVPLFPQSFCYTVIGISAVINAPLSCIMSLYRFFLSFSFFTAATPTDEDNVEELDESAACSSRGFWLSAVASHLQVIHAARLEVLQA